MYHIEENVSASFRSTLLTTLGCNRRTTGSLLLVGSGGVHRMDREEGCM